MSFIRRLFRREASSKLEWTSDVSKTAPPTFVPEIIRGKIWNVEDVDHLDKVARLDPLANFIVYGVAEMIFDDGYKFVDKDDNEIMEDALKELKRLNADRAFVQCLAAERTFGYAYQYTGRNKYIPEAGEGGRIGSLYCFTPKNCSVFEYDDTGNPKTLKLEMTVGKAHSQEGRELFLPAKDFIFWNTRPIGRGYQGRSVLEAIWDLLVYIRYLFHSMTFYDIKIGHGLFAAFVEAGYDETSLSKWETAFEDISIKRAMVVDKGQVDDIKFIGPTSNATDFVEHIEACVKALSVAVGIPAETLMGAAAGALSGSEMNIRLGDEQERKIKLAIDEYIRETVRRMGYSNEDYIIEWIEKTSHTEEERTKMEHTHAQAQAQKIHLTIDELREIDGYPPLPDGRGDKLASEQPAFGIDVQGLQEPKEEMKTQNPEGENI